MIEQTRFLSTVFLGSEFKLENIYYGVNFCGKNICGNFYMRELIFADRRPQKSQKLEPAKISCHTVDHIHAFPRPVICKNAAMDNWGSCFNNTTKVDERLTRKEKLYKN